jgi:hypothetical protein
LTSQYSVGLSLSIIKRKHVSLSQTAAYNQVNDRGPK